MENINIEAIIQNNFGFTDEDMVKLKASLSKGGYTDWNNWLNAIKEIVEAVIDKCAEKSFNTCDDSEFYDAVKVENILKVKEMINYE